MRRLMLTASALALMAQAPAPIERPAPQTTQGKIMEISRTAKLSVVHCRLQEGLVGVNIISRFYVATQKLDRADMDFFQKYFEYGGQEADSEFRVDPKRACATVTPEWREYLDSLSKGHDQFFGW